MGDYVDLETIPQPTEGVAGFEADPNLSKLRVWHCLTHTGGWVRSIADSNSNGFVDGIFPPFRVSSSSLLTRPGAGYWLYAAIPTTSPETASISNSCPDRPVS